MTAIALLNAGGEPYLVADTLLSAEGRDPREVKRIWLPALGSVPTEWVGHDGPWHISCLARKTFALPNNSGVLAFSGFCSPAFRFWDRLSDTWNQISSYDPLARINRGTLERILHQMPEDAAKFCLLGILIDESGHREAFVHNKHVRFETEQFGTCYAAGSGAEMIVEIAERLDGLLTRSGGWPSSYPISATEDLAEHISTEMLCKESDAANGIKPGTPLAQYCGGYYDWYKVETDGIRPMRPRIDLHVRLAEESLVVTRAYFVEQEQIQEHSTSTSQRIFTTVTNLGLSPVSIPLNAALEYGHTVTFDETWVVQIPSMFVLRDAQFGAVPQEPLSGPVTSELLAKKFPSSFEVTRVRVVVQDSPESAIVKRFIAPQRGAGDAALSVVDGKLSLWLSNRLLERTLVTAGA